MKICVYCVIQVFVFGVCFGIDLKQDLRKLSQMLPGVYSNNQRNLKNARHSFIGSRANPVSPVEALTTIPMSATYRPVQVTFLPDCFNVYVEQTLYGKQHPHRQWLYSFSVEHSTRSIRLKVYNFVKASVVDKISKSLTAIKYLGASDVMTRGDCDVSWRRLGQRFVGTTSRQCIAEVNGKQVRISVLTTLTSANIQIDEGWYNVHDGSKLIELDGPVVLTKIDTIADNPFLYPVPEEAGHRRLSDKHQEESPALQKDGRVRRHRTGLRGRTRDANQVPQRRHSVPSSTYKKIIHFSTNDVPDAKPEFSKRQQSGFNKYSPAEEKILSTVIRKAGFKDINRNDVIESRTPSRYGGKVVSPKKKKGKSKLKTTWNLQTYSGIIDALISGHKVYFTARTKRCSHSHATTVHEKTMFGDYIQSYDIEKDFAEKQPHKHISFTYKQMRQSANGFEEVVKDIRVHRNGSVHILTLYLGETGQLERQTFADCHLFTQDSRKGDVKFYLDPYRDVMAVPKFRVLRSALQKGKMIRMTTDLDKCSGGKSEHLVIGGEFRSYDLGRNGKTINVSFSRQKVTSSPNGQSAVEEQFYIFKFSKKGATTVLKHTKHVGSQTRNFSIVTGYSKYKCETDPNSSTKAISLFNS